jgi:hypothetical protein
VIKVKHFVIVFVIGLWQLTSALSEAGSSGISHRRIRLERGGSLDIVVVEKGSAKVKVVSSISSSSARTFGFEVGSNMTITDYADNTDALAVVSGGFMSSFRPPSPLGEIVISGRRVSPPHNSWLTTGMLCANERNVYVGEFNTDKIGLHDDCIQTGPIFIHDDQLRYTQDSSYSSDEMALVRSIQEQAFLCVTSTNTLILGTSSAMGLASLGRLAKDTLHCSTALRLTGYETTGLIYDGKLVGNDKLPLTSVIAIFEK